jgi:hypothetical protein
MFNVVKVFTTTTHRKRKTQGEDITNWLKANPDFKVVDKVVRLSSDYAYHCLTIILFGIKEGT